MVLLQGERKEEKYIKKYSTSGQRTKAYESRGRDGDNGEN